MEQVTNLMRGLEKQDVCDMEVDLAEVMWKESDAKIRNPLAHELETVSECPPAEEGGEEDVNMRNDDRRDEADGGNRHRWKMTSSVMDQCQDKKFIPSEILNGRRRH